MQVPNTSMNKS